MLFDNGHRSSTKTPVNWILAWLFAISTPTVFFLLLYVGIHGAEPVSILAHLKILAFLLSGMLALRTIVGLLFLNRSVISHVVRASIIAIFVYVLLLYYTTAVIGLYSWNRIFTVQLISGYLGSPFYSLLDSFGVPIFVLFIGLFGLFFALFCVFLFFERHLSWSAPFPSFIGRATLVFISSCLLLIFGSGLLDFFGNPRGDLEEPFALTLYPTYFGDDLQSLSINRALANRYDAAAEEERSSYQAPKGSKIRPTIVMFVVDGLRPDHMGVLGYTRDTTPFLQAALAAGDISKAGSLYSVCADSGCGLLALASSRYPHEFSSEFFSLYEVLELAGYRTSFMLSGDHRGFYGLAERYGDVDFLIDGTEVPNIPANDDAVLFEMLESFPDHAGNPTFFQFHLMSAHNLGVRWDAMRKFLPSKNYGFRMLRGSYQESVNFYDNGVRQADHVINAILQILDRKGYLDRYIVVVTSDHGEALGEQGRWSHSRFVINPVLKVPFILISSENIRNIPHSAEFVSFGSIVDIAPTILDLLSLPKPDIWSGQSLLAQQEPRTIFFRQGEKIGLVATLDDGSTFKYWRDFESEKEFVFELSSDPGETRNIVDQVPKSLLSQWRLKIMHTRALVESR